MICSRLSSLYTLRGAMQITDDDGGDYH